MEKQEYYLKPETISYKRHELHQVIYADDDGEYTIKGRYVESEENIAESDQSTMILNRKVYGGAVIIDSFIDGDVEITGDKHDKTIVTNSMIYGHTTIKPSPDAFFDKNGNTYHPRPIIDNAVINNSTLTRVNIFNGDPITVENSTLTNMVIDGGLIEHSTIKDVVFDHDAQLIEVEIDRQSPEELYDELGANYEQSMKTLHNYESHKVTGINLDRLSKRQEL